MPRNPNLIPTPTTNKNGVSTTVYKKPAKAAGTGLRLPKTSLAPNGENRNALERKAAEALIGQNFNGASSEDFHGIIEKDYQKLLAAMPAYDTDMLTLFIEVTDTFYGYELNDLLCSSYAAPDYISDWTIMVLAVDDNHVEELIAGLGEYEHLTPQEDGRYPDRRKEQVSAIARVSLHFRETGTGLTKGVNNNNAFITHIAEDNLRDLLTTHDDPAGIADIIITRGITDPDQITALIDTMNDTPNAISKGTL